MIPVNTRDLQMGISLIGEIKKYALILFALLSYLTLTFLIHKKTYSFSRTEYTAHYFCYMHSIRVRFNLRIKYECIGLTLDKCASISVFKNV